MLRSEDDDLLEHKIDSSLQQITIHSGAVFEEKPILGSAVPAIPTKEEAYIPVSFARSTIEGIQQDMYAMKQRHVESIRSVDVSYQEIQSENRDFYMQFISGLKNKAQSRIAFHKDTLRRAQAEAAEVQRMLEESLRSTQLRNTTLIAEKRELLESMQAERQQLEDEAKAYKAAATAKISWQRRSFEAMLAASKAELKRVRQEDGEALHDLAMEKEAMSFMVQMQGETLQHISEKQRSDAKRLQKLSRRCISLLL